MRIIVSLVSIAAACAVLSFLVPRTHVITRTQSGFTPSSLSIRPGDSVVFVGSGKPFWPASDAHPTHSFNPAFDPKRAIGGDEFWILAFPQPGSWTFHDHLTPRIRGTIHVSGTEPSLADCLSLYGTSTAQSYCWGRELTDIIEHKGLDAAFDALGPMNASPSFGSQCHDVMHILGQAAYHEFSRSDGTVYAHELTSACGFGFFHGFIESMLVDHGTNDLTLAREYCDRLERAPALPSDGARARAHQACYHGVGHALFDTVDASHWGNTERMVDIVTTQCERLHPTAEIQIICMSGVYNSLANAYSSKSYDLIPPPRSADRFCETQKPDYQSRCYTELTGGMLRRERFSHDDAIEHIRSLPPAMRSVVLRAYIDDEIRHYMSDPSIERTSAFCRTFSMRVEHLDCISGSLRAFTYMSSGDDDLADTLFRFCGTEEDASLRARCVGQARSHLTSTLSNEEARTLCERYFDSAACSTRAQDL